jgi:hypothetical protein
MNLLHPSIQEDSYKQNKPVSFLGQRMWCGALKVCTYQNVRKMAMAMLGTRRKNSHQDRKDRWKSIEQDINQ